MPETGKPGLEATDVGGLRKAAILLASVDPDLGARILTHLDKIDQERIALEIVRLESHPPDQAERDRVLRELYNLQLAQQYVEHGGADHARGILEKIYPPDEVRKILEQIESSTHRSRFNFLQKTDTEDLVTFLADEHPQTIALILAHLGPLQGAGILEELPPKKQQEVVKRLATMEHTSPEVVEQVEKALQTKLSSFVTQEFRKTGGFEIAAEVLNLMQRSTERSILEAISEEEPEMAEQIRRVMFTFEDIMRVNDRGVQSLVKNIDTTQLALALRNASDALKEKFFRNMSKRAVELIKEEMEYMGPVRLADVENAQRAIVDIVRRLEEQGELIIEGRGGAEEIVV